MKGKKTITVGDKVELLATGAAYGQGTVKTLLPNGNLIIQFTDKRRHPLEAHPDAVRVYGK